MAAIRRAALGDGRQARAVFTLPPIEGLTGDGKDVPASLSDLAKGEPTIVNVFASWCVDARRSIRCSSSSPSSPASASYGIDYKDDAAAARRFLGRYGNPYSRVGADQSGRMAIDFGVYGVPETYVITRRWQDRLPPGRAPDRRDNRGESATAGAARRRETARLKRAATCRWR